MSPIFRTIGIMKLFSMCRGCGRALTVSNAGLCRQCLFRYHESRRIQARSSEKKR
jgi:NMD protein affecting ribosome stability and mRNA decay